MKKVRYASIKMLIGLDVGVVPLWKMTNAFAARAVANLNI